MANVPQLTNHQIGALRRNLYPCDQCQRDRRRCEFLNQVPCARCTERGRPCTANGRTKEENYNLLYQENGNQRPFLFPRPEGDGYLTLMTTRGQLCLQHVTLHFVKIAPPMPVDAQALHAINTNQGPILAAMLNQHYDNFLP